MDMMDKNFEIIEHTADTGIRAWGKTKQELFQNAAQGMFFLITGYPLSGKKIKGRKSFQVQCQESGLENLLVSWLSDLLFLHHTKYMILTDFMIISLTGQSIQSEVSGVSNKEFPCSLAREIKAVTYHQLHIRKNRRGQWEATIIFDI